MKTTLFAMLIICATGAMGQSYGVAPSSELQLFQFPEHPAFAQREPMAREQNLRGEESPYTYGHGEIPLRDVAVSLGDVARRLRKEHEAAKKADIVWVD